MFYDYILAGNGIFVESRNALLAARVWAAECQVRGLGTLEEKLVLTYGSIPQRLWDLALDTFLSDPTHEQYVAVTGDAGYHFYIPSQVKKESSVEYEVGESVVLDLHSHGTHDAFFSPDKDDKDETGLKVYGVVGRLNSSPVVKLRVGVYGYFRTIQWKDIFDGSLMGAIEDQGEEVMAESGVCGEHAPDDTILAHFGRRMWWNRWFRS